MPVAARSLQNLRNTGRPPGFPNKVPQSIKEMVEKALTKVGGVDYLARQAERNPVAFLGLVGRIVPMQVASSDGSPVHLHLLAAVEVSREILERQQQQQPPTIEAERQELPPNLLDAPIPTE